MLATKVAVVTGGGSGSGTGRAICAKLASSGAQLIVADLNESVAKNTVNALPGNGHSSFQMDVCKSDAVSRLQHFIKSSGSTPSIIVNCARITKDSTLLKMSQKQWQNVIDVNLNSIFLMTQMIARESVSTQTPVSIVNVSSIVGKIGNFGQTNYSATKAGVIGFTKSATRELATKNIRVNAILLGFTQKTGINMKVIMIDPYFKTIWIFDGEPSCTLHDVKIRVCDDLNQVVTDVIVSHEMFTLHVFRRRNLTLLRDTDTLGSFRYEVDMGDATLLFRFWTVRPTFQIPGLIPLTTIQQQF